MVYQLKICNFKNFILFLYSKVQPKRRSGNLKIWKQNNNPEKNGKKGKIYYPNFIVEIFWF